MEITRSIVLEWLEQERRSQTWLAEQCGVSKQAVSNWLREKNPQAISAAAQLIITRLMAEDAAKSDAKPLQNLVLEFEDAQFEKLEKAALANRQTVRDWSKEILNGIASMDVADFVKQFFPERSRREEIVETASVITFPEVPLLRAAAGSPILADAEMIQPDRDLGEGRFILELRGDSMEPMFRDRQRVILRDKNLLKRPVLKYGELYCFVHDGQACFKQWAKDDEGNKVLRSLNPEHADIVATEETGWIGWFDPSDNA